MRLILAVLLAAMTLDAPMFTPRTADDFLACYEWGYLPDVICHEARGEPFDGKIAVGEVVLERMRDPRWGDTVAAVVLQPWQFSCYNANDPNATIRFKPQNRKEWLVFRECCEAAAEAIGGSNLTGKANHYVNLKVVRPAWFNEAKVTAVIGDHTFLRL